MREHNATRKFKSSQVDRLPYGCLLFVQISTADRTHARTGLDTQRAQAHNHTQNSNPRTHPRQTSRSHAHTHLPIVCCSCLD